MKNKEFNYVAPTFEVSVDGCVYVINSGKIPLLLEIGKDIDTLSDNIKAFSPEFTDSIYGKLRVILGEDNFNIIFKNYLYDSLFLSEFLAYLVETATPHIVSLTKRASEVSNKYNVESLNDAQPSDTQAPE